jgi:hypothetical protein
MSAEIIWGIAAVVAIVLVAFGWWAGRVDEEATKQSAASDRDQIEMLSKRKHNDDTQ